MEIKKEDLVKIRSFEDKVFYGIREDFLDEVVEEVVEEVVVSEEELIAQREAIAKEEKIAKLKADLKELEV